MATNGKAISLPAVMIIGHSGRGKSTAAMQALGPGALWIRTDAHALSPATSPELNPWKDAQGRCIIPDSIPCFSAEDPCGEVHRAMQTGAKLCAQGRYIGVVIDNLSGLADRAYHRISAPREYGGMGVKREYGRAVAVLAEQLQPILWLGRNMAAEGKGIFIVLAHERDSSLIEGNITYGGARLPGKLVALEPTLFSTVVRIDVQGMNERIWRCDPTDKTTFMKDAYHIIKDRSPADLRSFLQQAIEQTKNSVFRS